MTVTIRDTSTRDELAEALGHLARRAQREQTIIGSNTKPTAWDQRHEAIDELLDMMDAAG